MTKGTLEGEIKQHPIKQRESETLHLLKFNVPSREALLTTLLERYGENDGFGVFYSLSEGRTVVRVFGAPLRRTIGTNITTPLEKTPLPTFATENPFVGLEHHLEKSQGWNAGYLSYEALHHLEEVPKVPSSLPLPELVFYEYGSMIEHIEGELEATLYSLSLGDPLWRFDEAHLSSISPRTLRISPPSLTLDKLIAELAPFSNFDEQHYREGVEEIRERIRRGEVYQVNLSQRFSLPYTGDAKELFLHLIHADPPPRSAFITHSWNGKTVSYISASPELYFELEQGSVRCLPIKGTRRRSSDLQEDAELQRELRESEKDWSELAMIVDLVRNDLGRIALVGSVNVVEHAGLHTYATLHHLVSDVRATLPPSATVVDLIKAMFPCGSITGAPKIAAMKVIGELERTPRGIFSGTLGWIDPDGDAHFNIAIRTATITDETFSFHAGGGIVIDSDPRSEYEETFVKARTLYELWRADQN